MTVRSMSSYICNKCKVELSASDSPVGWSSLEFWLWQDSSTDAEKAEKGLYKDLCPSCSVALKTVLNNYF